MKRQFIILLILTGCLAACSKPEVKYIDKFANNNHPQVCYWFFSPELFENERYIKDADSIADHTLFDLVFLSAREGANFYDYQTMHPIFKKLVEHAHQRGIKIGLQLWENGAQVSLPNAQRMVAEHELTLDAAGKAKYTAKVQYFRFPELLVKCELLKVYAFRKTADEFYDKESLKDITDKCIAETPNKETVKITIDGGKELKGYTAFVMTQQYSTRGCKYSDEEINRFVEAFKAYADIPFDGFALDEYGSKYVMREEVFTTKRDTFAGRWYSPVMADVYQKSHGVSLEKTLLDMRYAPDGEPEVRAKAINDYMVFMRDGFLRVENAVCKSAKDIFGQHIFTGVHNTYHNKFTNDEIWANGINWWTIPREYGHSDEFTLTPTQMGIAMAYPANAMYNMFYHKDINLFTGKALNDLRFGIRTHYHAINDRHGWGVPLEKPIARDTINRVEKCARMMNLFNPSLPDIRLLVIFGNEALANWYPESAERGHYNINDKLFIEEKALEIWQNGYLNALLPSDLIVNKTITVGDDGKAQMNGHRFDAVIYLYPQYAREEVIAFLEEYQAKGGKLMIEGKATRNFNGDDAAARFASIVDKATVKGFGMDYIPALGVEKNFLPDGCRNEDGSYIFTDINSLRSDASANFSVTIGNKAYQGSYQGIALLKADNKGVEKMAATGFTELVCDGKPVLSFEKPVDLLVTRQGGKLTIEIEDKTHSAVPVVNQL